MANGSTQVAPGSVAAQLGGALLSAHQADVGRAREQARRARLRTLATVLAVPCLYLWWRILDGRALELLRVPELPPDWPIYLLPIAIVLAIGIAVAMPLLSGRSPHLRIRPEEIELSFADVKGLDGIVGEVTRTLNTFMGHKLFRDQLGGRPRRGLLFEGAPGTGKTHVAKAMAREAGVPFLFVSATSFQSMWYGATARRIRSYFAALRKVARAEGGAIGFIEEIDAIATARSGVSPAAGASPAAGMSTSRFSSSDGASGVVNELLIQLQSFDTPPLGIRVRNRVADALNAYLPVGRHLRARPSPYHNILVIAATNRADSLDPALLRPGRFDRHLTFELPAKPARRELIDYFLSRKAHDGGLADDPARDVLAGQTLGYTPVMLENLFDEALVLALRDGRDAMSWTDVQRARLEGEVGMPNPVPYTTAERRRVATHEAGHAVVAHLSQTRRLEVLSIIKRKGSLGLLAHGDLDEVYTRTRKELHDVVDIAMGGLAAEEIWFGDPSTGPGSDLAHATRTACEIVGVHGMGDSLVSLAAVENSAFNDTNVVGRVLADPAARPQVDRLLWQSRDRVRALLDANRHLVVALRDALLDRDELIGEDIDAVLRAAGPPVLDDLAVEVDGLPTPGPTPA